MRARLPASMFCALMIAQTAAFGPTAPARTFATFGNAQTKSLIKAWSPQPLAVPTGEVLLPASAENMKRFVRARILLEDPSLGCVASFDDSLCVILCRFSKAEHQLLLPLWRPQGPSASKVFGDLLAWHRDSFGNDAVDAPRLSGARLETDREAWSEAKSEE